MAMISILKFSAILFTISFSLNNHSNDLKQADDIVGIWMPSEGTAYVKIFKEKGKEKFHGKIVWLKEPNDENGKPKTDPDGKPILNMMNLKNFVFEDGKWVDGTIYDPKTGKTYYCTIEMLDKNKLEVRGSLDAFGIIGRTDTWVRMKTN